MNTERATKLKSIITVCVFAAILGGFFLIGRISKPPAVLEGERRPPAAMPELSFDSIRTGMFMSKFENYAADTFPCRESFRTAKAFAIFKVFRQTDMDGLYIDSNGLGKFLRPDEKNIRESLAKLNRLKDKFCTSTAKGGFATASPDAASASSAAAPNIHFAIIPDKSIYSSRHYPGTDPSQIAWMKSGGAGDIDLTTVLDADSYYRTDLHWDQSRIEDVVKALTTAMASTDSPKTRQGDKPEMRTAGTFKGVYAGQTALPVKPDTMRFVENDAIRNAQAKALDPKTGDMKPMEIYDSSALSGVDPYNFFLGGPQALITIDNPEIKKGRELYMLRDSFGSSLAPLLIPYYSRITLIDLRYIDSRVLNNYISPVGSGTDILFMYSEESLNSPSALLTE